MNQFKHLIPFLLFVQITYCSGADYYIDSVNGSDENNGLSISTPWKSHIKAETVSLSAGDVVHFKKGSSFSGNIRISESGTATKPIRLTSYGKGKLPKFTNPTTRDANGNAITLGGDYIIVENLHFTIPPGKRIRGYHYDEIGRAPYRTWCDHCIIRKMNSLRPGRASCQLASIP